MTDTNSLRLEKLTKFVQQALDDLKAVDVATIDISEMSSVADRMIVATGNSNRHVKSIASNVVSEAKQAGFRPLGVEGEDSAEWVLVDLGDLLLHVMLPDTRSFYDLEKLWTTRPTSNESSEL